MIKIKWLDDETVKDIPLKTRIKVRLSLAFMDIKAKGIIRSNETWTDDKQDLLDEIFDLSDKLSTDLVKEVEQWELDGKP